MDTKKVKKAVLVSLVHDQQSEIDRLTTLVSNEGKETEKKMMEKNRKIGELRSELRKYEENFMVKILKKVRLCK
jgi:ABC-type Fe3+-citrate transport system substrate-binding protein